VILLCELITFLKRVVNMKSTKASLILRSTIFSGWLIQLKAMLRELDCDENIETPIPKDVDEMGIISP
jgi:O-phosphoseryl-tRNA(Cys) synthetase